MFGYKRLSHSQARMGPGSHDCVNRFGNTVCLQMIAFSFLFFFAAEVVIIAVPPSYDVTVFSDLSKSPNTLLLAERNEKL